MSADRELLEMAAKAAGVVVDKSDDSSVHGLHGSMGAFYVVDANGWHYWEPLTDDGEALRLAVKLGFCVTQWSSASGFAPHVMVGYSTGPNSGTNLTEDHAGDPYAATRRAIVRAAAEIGKAMP